MIKVTSIASAVPGSPHMVETLPLEAQTLTAVLKARIPTTSTAPHPPRGSGEAVSALGSVHTFCLICAECPSVGPVKQFRVKFQVNAKYNMRDTHTLQVTVQHTISF